MLGDGRGIGHALRRHDHEQAVARGILRKNLHGFGVALGPGITQDVDGVAMAPVGRQDTVESGLGFGRELSQFSIERHHCISCQYARATRIGQDGEPRTRRPRLLGQHFRHVEQVRNIVDAQNAAAPEGGFEHLITTRKRARMRGRCFSRSFTAPGLDHDDGLAQRHLARSRQKRARIADGFHVNDDRASARIVTQVIDQISPAHIQHRADGEKRAEAHHLGQAPVENRGADGAALAHQRDVSGPGDSSRESGIEAGERAHHAQTVGADDAHVAAPGRFEHLTLEIRAVLPCFLEAGRNDDRALDAGSHTFAHHAGHSGSGRDDDGQIHLVGHVGDFGIGTNSKHARAFRIYGKHGTAERAVNEIPENGAAHTGRRFSCADHGHIARGEEDVERAAAQSQNIVGALGSAVNLSLLGHST